MVTLVSDDLSHNLMAQKYFLHLSITLSENVPKVTGKGTPSSSKRGRYNRLGCFRGLGRGASSSSDRNTKISQAQEQRAPNQKK